MEELDLYIYHDSQDNDDFTWVSHVKDFMGAFISETLGHEVEFKLLDETSNILSFFSPTILVFVLSENLLSNEASMKTLDNMIKALSLVQTDDLEPDKKAYKVLKDPLALEQHTGYMQTLSSYSFLSFEKESSEYKKILTYQDFFTVDTQDTFWISLTSLCYDIVETIDIQTKKRQGERNKRIYLAEVGQDIFSERLKIKIELKKRGFIVLPEEELPSKVDMLENKVYNDLHKCFMSIHLFGEDYGEILNDGNQISFPELQNQFAARFARENPDFKRMVWVLPHARHIDQKQRFFVSRFKKDKDESYGAEVIEAKIEDFKTALFNILLKRGNFSENVSDEYRGQKMLYLMADSVDYEEVQNVKDWLEAQSYFVCTSFDETDPKLFRESHFKYLRECDAAFICCIHANEQWIFSKMQDILKANGLGRTIPLKNKAIYVKGEKKFQDIQKQISNYSVYRDIALLHNKDYSISSTLSSYIRSI